MSSILLYIARLLAEFYQDILHLICDIFSSLSNTIQHLYRFAQSYWLAVFALTYVLHYFYQKHVKKSIKRDYQYLVKRLHSEGSLFPSVTIDELTSKIAGQDQTQGATKQIRRILNTQIQQVVEFLQPNAKHNVTIINAPWGSGKTTTLLLSLEYIEKKKEEEEKKNGENNTHKNSCRYIYESAFKYANGLENFTEIVLRSVSQVLVELGITGASPILDKIIKVLEPDPKETFPLMLREFFSTHGNQSLTYDLIHDVNEKYAKNNLSTCVYIIIDDMDRLLGNDIYKIISFLSILRRLSFVKIIILADLSVITEQLKNINASQPEKFVQKYLPECSTIKLKNSYDIIEQIVLQKIKGTQKTRRAKDNTIYCGAWAAVLIKIFSEILDIDSKTWSSMHIETSAVRKTSLKDDIKCNRASQLILNGSIEHIHRQVQICKNSNGTLTYTNTLSSRIDAREIEKILLSASYGGASKQKITDNFTEEAYQDFIANWIFDFSSSNWAELNIDLRTIMFYLENIEGIELKQTPVEQFVQVFNTFFPDTPITLTE